MKKRLTVGLVIFLLTALSLSMASAAEITPVDDKYNFRIDTNGHIYDYTLPDDENCLLIPYQVDGQQVLTHTMEPLMARKDDVYVFSPLSTTGFSMFELTEEVGPNCHGFIYCDYAAFVEIYGSIASEVPFSFMLQENQIALINYTLLENSNKEQYNASIDYKDIPKVLNGMPTKLYIEPSQITAYTSGEFQYIKLTDSTVAISRHTNENSKKVVIPAEIDGFTVTEIGCYTESFEYAIQGNNIEKLELPDTLTRIGDFAIFSDSLKSLTIPDSVTAIGNNAIVSYSLKALKLPDSITSIGSEALVLPLKKITLPKGMTEISDYCFNTLVLRISSITVPAGVTKIGKAAFAGLESLTTLKLPDGITSIPDAMVKDCTKLSKITIPEKVTTIGINSFSGCLKLSSIKFEGAALTDIGQGAFSNCTKLAKFVVPSGVTSIGAEAFYGCIKLTSVTIPESVTSIGKYAFEDCGKKLVLTVTEGSFAQQWAEENGLKTKVAKKK